MSKFIRVKEAPKTLTGYEHIIYGPNFMEEVEAHSKRRPRGNVIGLNYLRDILILVCSHYADPTFEPISGFNLSNYKDRPSTTLEDDHKIVLDVITTQQPKILQNYLDKKIALRPLGTEVIYYVGSMALSARFIYWGIQEINAADLKKIQKDKKQTEVPNLLFDDVEIPAPAITETL